MRFLPPAFLLAMICLTTSPLFAADTADSLFQRGVERFRSGDYRRALEDFEAAERRGMRGALLDYNLGSVHYRLRNYPRSRLYFDRLTEHETLAGAAWYNLALIAHRLDDDELSMRLFLRAAEKAVDPGLRGLAERQRQKLLAARDGGKTPAAPRLTGVFNAGMGWDSNIELSSRDGGSEQEGAYLRSLVYAELAIGRAAQFDWLATGIAYANAYPDNADFDYQSIAPGVTGRRRIEGWDLSLDLQSDRSRLDSGGFLVTDEVALRLKRPLAGDRQIAVELREARIVALRNSYDNLTGNRARFGLEWRTLGGDRRYRFRWRLEDNRRRNADDSDNSPRRQSLDFGVVKDLAESLQLDARLEYRHSRYREVAELRRSERRWRLDLGFRRPLGRDWRLRGLVQFTDNDSELAESDYRRTLLGVTFERFF